MSKSAKTVTIAKAKGRPMLQWVGKSPLRRVPAYPAQAIERFAVDAPDDALADVDWSDWPDRYPRGGLLFHGDNKDVLGHLLANGFRGKVKLIYIDPPFDSGADYVRTVKLRGVKQETTTDGDDYSLGEQIQYTDIWAKDNYLQFLYERLLLLRELLSDNGSIFLHCDERRVHLIRCVLDEIFGAETFNNEITWFYSNKYGANSRTFDVFHNSILWYSNGRSPTYNAIRVSVKKARSQPLRKWNKDLGKNEWLTDADGNYLYQDSTDKDLGDVWDIPVINPMAHERLGFPTQKPEELLHNIVSCASGRGDLVLDAFLGSGTTASVAQRLGRRWIGCDINKGAIQTTAKRLQTVLREQAEAATEDRQGKLVEDAEAPPAPAQFAFSTWRVNDYDLQIQHNEAVALACEHLGVTRTRSDAYFDGTQGARLVKIVPFNHPLTPHDLGDLKKELAQRPDEERNVTVVCLGVEIAARAWVERHNRAAPINRVEIIELRSDPRYGGIISHQPMSASVVTKRVKKDLVITVTDVFSPTIVARLEKDEGLFRAEIEDWRAVVDCIMVDSDYDGEVFNVTLSDVPARKQDLVDGTYTIAAPKKGSVVAVKIIDMLGEETVVTQVV